MRIALVAPLVAAIREPQRGGSQAFVSDLARGLVARGHEVHLYAASGSAVAGVTVIDTGVDHRSLAATLYRASGSVAVTPGAADAAFARVYSAIDDGQYDVIHNHAFDAPAVRLAIGLRAPVVHTLHLPPADDLVAALREANLGHPPPTLAAVSESQARAWGRVVPIGAVLPPYVPTDLIRWSPPAGHGAVFAGRLSPEKGAAQAIDIARLARIHVDVYGDRYDPIYAADQIDPRQSEPGVTVHPAVPRSSLWAALARAAVVLCPARWDEPFGMVAAEAQACGTPVVAFDRGALGEVIVDGQTGFLITPDDIPAAAVAVGGAVSLAREDCRRHAELRLDLQRSLDDHEGTYRRVVAAAAGAPIGG